MRLEITSAHPIKPMVVRFAIDLYDNDNNLTSEYEIAIDIEEFLQYEMLEDRTNINIDGSAIQQYLTDQVVEMQFTAMVARNFTGLSWEANEPDEENETTDTA